MNSIEDRIRAAASAAADTVPPDGVPPLRLPPAGRRRHWRLAPLTAAVAPLAAAVAVAAVVIAMVGIGRAVHDSASAPRRAAPETIASLVAAGLVPRYYVEISTSGSAAAVRATATGKTLATIAPPTAGDLIVAVSAAADDRTFVLAARSRASASAVTFYQFRLSSTGRPGRLGSVPGSVPGGATMTGFALSPRGDKLAVASTPGHNEVEIKVYSLVTAAVPTWTATASDVGPGLAPVTAPGDVTTLSWALDERTLAFAWGGNGTRLISPGARSGNLISASRAGFGGTGQGWTCMGSPVITGDGTTLACGARVWSPESVSNDQIGYAEYATAGGKLERVVGQRLAGPEGPTLGWVNASGSVLIGGVQANLNSPLLIVGVITGDHFLPLPGSPDLLSMNIAW
jgi:hypothetical protein